MQTASLDLLDIDPLELVEDEPPWMPRVSEAWSPAVRLMMFARALEADDTFSRKGKMVTVNRGKGGKFARKGAGDVGDAADAVATGSPPVPNVAAVRQQLMSTPSARRRDYLDSLDLTQAQARQLAKDLGVGARRRGAGVGRSDKDGALDAIVGHFADVEVPEKAPAARRSAVAKALASGDPNALDGMSREALRREAKARGLEPPRGVSEDVLKDMLWDDEGNAAISAGREKQERLAAGRPDEHGMRAALLSVPRGERREELAFKIGGHAPDATRRRAEEVAAGMGIDTSDVERDGQGRPLISGLLDRIVDEVNRQDGETAGGGSSGDALQVDSVSPQGGAIDVLKSAQAGDGDKVRAVLDDMSRAELVETAKALKAQGLPVLSPLSGDSEQALKDAIFTGTVGYQDRAKAIFGGASPGGFADRFSVVSKVDPVDPVDAPPSRAETLKAATPAKRVPRAAKPASTATPGERAQRMAAASSREQAAAELDGLTVAQMRQVADAAGVPAIGRDKEELRQNLVEALAGNRLNSAGIRRGGMEQTSSERERAERQAADDIAAELNRSISMRMAQDAADATTSQAAAGYRASGDEESAKRAEKLGVQFRRGLLTPDDLTEQLAEVAAAARPSGRGRKPAGGSAKRKDAAEKIAAAANARAEADAIIGNPEPQGSDREKLRGLLSGMTIPQLKQLAKDHGLEYDSSGTKVQQVGRFVEHAIGFRLNSQTLRARDFTPSGDADPKARRA